jgi:large subunit ribosomal protein L7/L12
MAEKLSVDEFVEMFGQYTVIELAEMKEKLKEKYDIEAAAPIMGGFAMPGAPGAGGEEAEEKTEFDVILKETGSAKIKVIKAIREVTDLGLKEAKAIADEPPKAIREAVSKEEAEKIKETVEGAGGVVEIK